MRHAKTIKRYTVVHLYDSVEKAEIAMHTDIPKVRKLGKLETYRWTGQLGSYDSTDFRVYFMTEEKFAEWKKLNVYDDVNYDAITVKGGE